jgi:hypothetical protein
MEHSIVAADGVDWLERLDGESVVGTVVDGKLRSVGGVAGRQQQGGKQEDERGLFHCGVLFAYIDAKKQDFLHMVYKKSCFIRVLLPTGVLSSA